MYGLFVLQLVYCQCSGALRAVPNSSQIKCLSLSLSLSLSLPLSLQAGVNATR
jgi:hypothetical protein